MNPENSNTLELKKQAIRDMYKKFAEMKKTESNSREPKHKGLGKSETVPNLKVKSKGGLIPPKMFVSGK